MVKQPVYLDSMGGKPTKEEQQPCGLWGFTLCCLARDTEDPQDEDEPLLRKDGITKNRNVGSVVMEHGRSDHLKDHYTLEKKVLGKGGFGTVKRGYLKSNPAVVRAVKEVRKKSALLEKTVHREIEVLKRLDHPNICRLFETYEDMRNIYMVLEYIEGRELFDELQEQIQKEKRFDEHRAACIMHQVYGALQYCHDREIIHRDLKPENIMVRKQAEGADTTLPVVKIIDFGLAVLCRPAGYNTRHLEGTEAYLAPEARKGTFLPVSDTWSTGVILHIILLGGMPLPGGKIAAPENDEVLSDSARDLLEGLLKVETSERFNASQARDHPWTTGNYARSPRTDKQLLQAVTSFKDFCQGRELRRAALSVMASQLSDDHMERLREQFVAMDTDGNGVISKAEMLEAMQRERIDGITDIEAWVESTFEQVDCNGSGCIEFTEWQAAVMKTTAGITEEAVREAFRVFASEETGTISSDQLGRFLLDGPDELKECMCEFDLNGDGVIDYDEFRAMFIKSNASNAVSRCASRKTSLVLR